MTSPVGGRAAAELFERMPVRRALMRMAAPAIASQLVLLFYNIADTWFIGQTGNPHMVAASSLVLTVFFVTAALGTLFGTGGGTLMVQLLGAGDEGEARRAASLSLVLSGGLALLFSLLCLLFMEPLLVLLGASANTLGYAKQYMFFVLVLGGLPAVLSQTMSSIVRNAGYSREAGFGLSMGGLINVALDPVFMFLLLPDGYEVMGAAIATMLSNVITLIYFIVIYLRLRGVSVLELPVRIERVRPSSLRAIFSVGVPAAAAIMLFDLTNMVINRLAAGYGDTALAAVGIVLKIERLPLNICIGICLGMMPLVAYNYAAHNYRRMDEFFTRARLYGVAVSLASMLLYRIFALPIMSAFISDPDTVRLGAEFLKVRCLASVFMFLSFHMVHLMQSVERGGLSFRLAAMRQLCLNIPLLLLFERLFGVMGIVWTQVAADALNTALSYLIYSRVSIIPARSD